MSWVYFFLICSKGTNSGRIQIILALYLLNCVTWVKSLYSEGTKLESELKSLNNRTSSSPLYHVASLWWRNSSNLGHWVGHGMQMLLSFPPFCPLLPSFPSFLHLKLQTITGKQESIVTNLKQYIHQPAGQILIFGCVCLRFSYLKKLNITVHI